MATKQSNTCSDSQPRKVTHLRADADVRVLPPCLVVFSGAERLSDGACDKLEALSTEFLLCCLVDRDAIELQQSLAGKEFYYIFRTNESASDPHTRELWHSSTAFLTELIVNYGFERVVEMTSTNVYEEQLILACLLTGVQFELHPSRNRSVEGTAPTHRFIHSMKRRGFIPAYKFERSAYARVLPPSALLAQKAVLFFEFLNRGEVIYYFLAKTKRSRERLSRLSKKLLAPLERGISLLLAILLSPFWLSASVTGRVKRIPFYAAHRQISLLRTHADKPLSLLNRLSLSDLSLATLDIAQGRLSFFGPRIRIFQEGIQETAFGTPPARHRAKPGLFGWAQLNQLKSKMDLPEETLDLLDDLYVDTQNPVLDCKILIKTVLTKN